MIRIPAVLLVLGSLASAEPRAKERLRVFVLVGQSNMQGKGKIQHLEELIADPAGAKEYAHLKKDGAWVKRDDVFIKYWDRKGPLTVGYGDPADRIGPELGFGQVVGDAFEGPVLLIKVAWGGQSLGRDFRPPSAGLPSEGRLAEILAQTNAGNEKKKRPATTMEEIKKSYGQRYREVIREVHAVLADLKTVCPLYDGAGYELSGLVYFQGFNDVINDEFRAEYASNMIHFVRDIRKDLGVEQLPVVIGELGMNGVEMDPRYAEKHLTIRRAQEAPSKMPEFAGTVAYGRTAPYVVAEGKSYDGGYHYRGRADTFYQIGLSFGRAMLPLVKEGVKDHREKVGAAGRTAKERYGF